MKKLKFLFALAAIFSSLVWIACKKDIVQLPSKADRGQLVKTSFTGQVIDENGQPVADAVIRVGGNSLKTDANGAFILRNQEVWSKRAIVQVFKAGYWTTSRTLFVNNKSSNSLIFRLLQKKTIGSFTGSTGGKLGTPDGLELDFAAGSVMKNGAVYSGKVNVAARFLDPFSPTLLTEMPGDLRGLDEAGEESILTTFGMVGVELTDASGQELQVLTGQTVTMSVKIADPSKAPDRVPMWHFSETEGLWEKDGEAEKQGDRYVATVSHFSWWNYDATAPRVVLSGKIVDETGAPVSEVHVWLCPETQAYGVGCGHGEPDQNGMFIGAATKDVPLKIIVFAGGLCGGSQIKLLEQSIGTFSNDADLGTFTVATVTADIQTVEISGTLADCANNPLANGYVKVTAAGYFQLAFPDAAGVFSVKHTFCTSNPPGSYTITAWDLTNAKQSDPITVAAVPIIFLGNLAACTSLAEYIYFKLDNSDYSIIDPSGGFDGTYGTMSGPFSPNGQSQFYLQWDGKTVGEHDVQYISIYGSGIPALDSTIIQQPFKIQVDQLGNVGDPTIGSFNGTVKDATNQTHTVTGTYKVNRDF